MASTTENREAPQEIQEQEVEVDEESKQKLSDRIAKEAARLKDLKLVPLVLSVKNYGVVRHNNSLINRIEVDTGFDFGLIKQIMYSEPVPCDWKPGFNYVHLILLAETASTTAMSHPILIPYIYPTTLLPDPDTTNTKSSSSSSGSTKPIKNDLKEWLLVNAKGARVRHSVNEFH
ncbi:hypothetical protein BC832DRAFT_423677 [Gaertneriomyces semiglobifer]|nr:hypothetical protein BC832DRAFT_423677 [Gaertneriomyces semiglobifer]